MIGAGADGVVRRMRYRGRIYAVKSIHPYLNRASTSQYPLYRKSSKTDGDNANKSDIAEAEAVWMNPLYSWFVIFKNL